MQPTITIAEGPLTLIGEHHVRGQRQRTRADLLRRGDLRRGRAVLRTARASPTARRCCSNTAIADLRPQRRGGAVTRAPTARGPISTFQITEGQQTIVDHVLIIGNVATDQRVIQRELLLQQGKPLGLEDLDRKPAPARRARAVPPDSAIEELSHGGAASDVLVTVEEAAATTFSYGGGLEAERLLRRDAAGQAQERLEFAPRGFFDVGRRNLGGKNRSVDLYTRLSLRPSQASFDGSTKSNPFGFSDYRIVGTYREPRAIGLNADLSFTAAVEQGVRSTFNFARKGINAEVARRLGPGLRTSARYSFGTTRTFDETLSLEDQARIDRIFPQVRLSAFSGAFSRDTRDDVLDPERGTFVSAEGHRGGARARRAGRVPEVVRAGFLVPSSAGPQARRRLRRGLRWGSPTDFPRVVESTDEDGRPMTVTVEDLPASERFFAGGDTTIRGFALDTVGAPNTISPTGFPRGGNALLLMNGELRVPVWKDFGAAFFLDGGNVFDRATEFDFGELRGSAGLACAIARRSGRSASTSASSWIGARAAPSPAARFPFQHRTGVLRAQGAGLRA